ncbi:MAG: DUF1598 domain-containing protein [Planctomycetota bacterium]
MNLPSVIYRFFVVLGCTPGFLFAQSTERLGKEYPLLAQALTQRDPGAIQSALGQLAPSDRQRVLTVLHSQKIDAVSLHSGAYDGSSSRSGSSLTRAGEDGGAAGGGAIADYSELMRLIETTISPDGWQSAGGTATMSPFRQGVRITTDGLIERISSSKQNGAPKLKVIPEEVAKGEPIAVPLDDLGQWQKPTDLRWISLKTLDEQLHFQVQQDARGSIASELLGGLCRIDYLAWDSKNNDWLIGGPAGNIAATRQGDLVHRQLKLPPVLLEDLLTVAQHVLNGKGEFGCSIDPVPERLIAAYQSANEKASIRLLGRDPETWIAQWKKKLGFQKANVVGIAQDSPTGYALLIADAHMKRLAFGLEPSVNGLANYWVESERLGYAKEQSMVRWWFAMSDSKIALDPQEQIYHFQGSNVAVLSETQMMGADGTRFAAQIPARAADAFAKNFTANFQALQEAYPIYGRLRHVFDLAVVMEIIKTRRASQGEEQTAQEPFKVLGKANYLPHLEVAPTQIDSIVATRKRSDGTISAIVSGGVSIEPKLVKDKIRVPSEMKNRVSVQSSPGDESVETSILVLEERFWK